MYSCRAAYYFEELETLIDSSLALYCKCTVYVICIDEHRYAELQVPRPVRGSVPLPD